MLYKLGRFLQVIGMILLPLAIAGDLAREIDLRTSLTLSAVGVTVFVAGYLLQQLGKRA